MPHAHILEIAGETLPYPNPVGQTKNCILKDKDTLSSSWGL
jgi:hypothetical protein